jgi:hypothetical protein
MTITTDNSLLHQVGGFNLQLFAGAEGAGTDELDVDTESGVDDGSAQPDDGVAKPEWLDEKFKGDVEAQAKAYHEAQKNMHQNSQLLSETDKRTQLLEQNNAELREQLNILSTPKPEPVKQWEPEEIPDELWEEDPKSAVAKDIRNRLAPLQQENQNLLEQVTALRDGIDTIQNQKSFEKGIAALQREVGDAQFAKMQPIMVQLAQNNPAIEKMDNPVKILYEKAVEIFNGIAPEPTQAKSLEEQLNDQIKADPVFAKKLASNPEISKVLLSSIQEGKSPVVIGGQPGGQPPAVPEGKPERMNKITERIQKAKNLFR